MQFINYHFSGNKPADLDTLGLAAGTHVAAEHAVKIVDAGWEKMLGTGKILTNSYHRQGFLPEQISKELDILAVSEDGVVEALRHKKYPIVGIQWHPERKSPDDRLNSVIAESLIKKTNYWS